MRISETRRGRIRVSTMRWNRRRLLAILAAGGLVSVQTQGSASAAQVANPRTLGGGLVHKGINYDTGTDYTPEWGVLTLQTWDRDRVTRDLTAIHDDLHCTAVVLFGREIDRLAEAGVIAAERGLHVWLQPRLIDAERPALIDYLTQAATEAERLRGEHPETEVTLNVGVEWSLFAAGVIPGETFLERMPTLIATLDLLPEYNRRLNELLGEASETARAVFNGPVTYSAGPWESVDWEAFDIVGMDLYRDAENAATYVQQLRALTGYGKPVVITEFGCCTYEGAAGLGGAGYDIVDWGQSPPQLTGDYVRSEEEQAGYVSDLIALYEEEGIDGAFVYGFVEPEMTHDPDPHFDLDMASFGVVKTFPAATGQGYEETGYWVPKAAFAAIAKRFR